MRKRPKMNISLQSRFKELNSLCKQPLPNSKRSTKSLEFTYSTATDVPMDFTLSTDQNASSQAVAVRITIWKRKFVLIRRCGLSACRLFSKSRSGRMRQSNHSSKSQQIKLIKKLLIYLIKLKNPSKKSRL